MRDLYNAERQILKALPKMSKAASSPDLQKGFQEHLQQTQTQMERLDKIFTDLGESPKGKKCEAMEGLLKEGAELLEADAEPSVLDAPLIAAAEASTTKLPATDVREPMPNCLGMARLQSCFSKP